MADSHRLGPDNPGLPAMSLARYIREQVAPNYPEAPELAETTPGVAQAYLSFHGEWQRKRNSVKGEDGLTESQREKLERDKIAEGQKAELEIEKAAKREAKEAERAERAKEREAAEAKRAIAREEREKEREAKREQLEAEKAEKEKEREERRLEREAKKAEREQELEAKKAEREAARAAKAESGADGNDGSDEDATEDTGRGALRNARSKLKRRDPATVGASEPSF